MKKKVISMMLALALVYSEIPAYTLYAAEISEYSAEALEYNETAEKAEPEETEAPETVKTETIKTTKAAEEGQGSHYFDFHVADNGKAVGSDGVPYDGVVYLSADTVSALDEGMQTIYFDVCDSIAELKAQEDALNGAVIAVDEDGNLHYSISIPTIRLAEGNLFHETLKEDGSASIKTEASEETETETEIKIETELAENAFTEEATAENSEDAATEGRTTENWATEEANAEETTQEATVTETAAEPESSQDENTETGETVTNSETNEETESAEETTQEETTQTEETASSESETKGYALSAENMELLEYGEKKTFEVVENVKAEPIADLGYGSGFSQFYSTLDSNTYFKNQLDSVEKKIYDAGAAKLLHGENSFEFDYPYSNIKNDHESGKVHRRTLQAVSAIIMQHPYEMDWMDLSEDGETLINVGVIGGLYYSGKFEFVAGVSRYYNASLVRQANAQVNELAKEAQEYALANYPADPVYGIVKYFDNWICRNNYYEMIGVNGGKTEDSPAEKEAFFYCHSSYGILLKGYGVCESYALAMTRLLDALGIPNMYATGTAITGNTSGGHAWNYVAMPDGKWYLQDSTWNDTTDPRHVTSTEEFLLRADDGDHRPEGNRWVLKSADFKFAAIHNESYNASKGSMLNMTECNLKVKETAQLEISGYYGKIYASSITSSNPKVAKVDKNGKITAVSGGQAEIIVTYNLPNMRLSDTCTVNVYQLKSLVSERTKKASDTISLGTKGGSQGSLSHITLIADCGDGIDVEAMIRKEYIEEPKVTPPAKNSVANINVSGVTGNAIELEAQPIAGAAGTASYKITLGGKTVTLKVSVGETIDQNYFEIDSNYVDADYTGKTLPYTGKAMKPKVTKKADAPKELKFKTTYYNNKDAGTASIVVTGTGKYAGEETFTFEIAPLELTSATVTAAIKPSSIVYNGGVSQIKSTVKYTEGRTKLSLKAGVDYDIVYQAPNGGETTVPQDSGKYTVAYIEGKGSFTGTYKVPSGITYEIKPISAKKVKISFTPDYDVTVKIGKNTLAESDYTVKYYEDKKCEKELSYKPVLKGTYYVKVQAGSSGNLSDGEKVAALKIK